MTLECDRDGGAPAPRLNITVSSHVVAFSPRNEVWRGPGYRNLSAGGEIGSRPPIRGAERRSNNGLRLASGLTSLNAALRRLAARCRR
jgi:hypothetical protein